MAAPVIESVAKAANGNSTSPSCSAPAGIVAGELLVAFVNFDGLGANITGGPAGWTKLGGLDPSDVRVGHEIWWKEATGAEPGSYAWSQSASRRTAIGILRISGWDNTGTLKIAIDSAVQASTTTPLSPSITTDVADSLVLWGAASEFGNLSYTPPSGTTEKIDIETGSGGDAGTALGVASEVIATAGATGTRQWSSSSTARFICSSVAIPAPSGGGGSTVSGDGTSAGTSTASGAGSSVAEADGAAGGAATAAGDGQSTVESSGSSAGTSTATGQGQIGGSVVEGDGSSTGSATASGDGQATATGDGSSGGTSTASGQGETAGESVGQSDGTSTASGEGQSTAEADGTSAGAATASGQGESTAEGQGASAGTSTTSGVGSDATENVGQSDGSSTATGDGQATAEGAGASGGAGSATSDGESTAEANGTSSGAATATGQGQSSGGNLSRGRVAFPEDSANSGSVVSNQAAGYVINPNNSGTLI